jgi:hypothetical protein
MRKRLLALPVAALAVGLVGAAPAQAHPGHGSAGTAGSVKTSPVSSKAPSAFFAAQLSGKNEVPAPGGPAVGDPQGRGVALVKIKGDRVSFSVSFSGIKAPTLGHIHEGKAGVNGPVKITLFGSALPDTTRAAAGSVTLTDAKLAKTIRTNPAGFYVNLHSAEFPGGAVRGQLKSLNKRVDVLSVVKGGGFRALLDGGQEVPAANGAAVGDRNGHAVSFVRARGTTVDYSLAWVGIGAPTLGHVHQGKAGVNGPVKVNLFTTPVPETIFALSGSAPGQDAQVVKDIRKNPKGFYVNIHTAEFPGGAVRGQLFR